MLVSANGPLDRARTVLERQGRPPAEFLPPDIYDSWMRCISFGLDTRHPPVPGVVSQPTLRHEQNKCSLVRGLALAEMHTLHQQIAGSHFMIAFASADGILLDVVADKSFTDTSDAAAIQPGSIWTEAACGTNGLGTAAHLKRTVVVHGGEHFFQRYSNLTCAASPVFAPDGTLTGVLDASSSCTYRQAHTQALVAMAATQIENGLFREQHRGSIMIAFHNRGEYLHTLSAGLLAVDSDGRILATNQAARTLLHGLPASPGRRFSDVFRTKFSAFIDESRRQEKQRLQDDAGSHFIATIEIPRHFPMLHTPPKTQAEMPKPTAAQFVYEDSSVAAVVRRVEMAALRKMPILVRGETGTGKEQLARHAHVASQRSGPFIAVNCAALPESLIESELFGYAEGSFTGAKKGGSTGFFREADGGTLFLDEIGDMPVALQTVLLRFLDDWTIRPVGGSPHKVDVLLVSATNANLESSIERRRFRADLLFRLNTLDVTLPPLRERMDFEQIARHLIRAIDPSASLTTSAIERLAESDWPGNIRELRNVLSRLSLGEYGELIDGTAVERLMGDAGARQASSDNLHSGQLTRSLHELQKARVLATLAETDGNVSKTARRLGASRNLIYRILREQPGDGEASRPGPHDPAHPVKRHV
jgi:sigma-54 dependent transcriptional regulator, acetoin dehydrogenase operon transcriptional activator AcoR